MSNAVEATSAVVQAVRELAPGIADRADEIESKRHMPADLHEQLREAGVYRILLPESHGGEQAGPDDVLDVIETLSNADGSVAWTATIGIQTPCLLSLLPRETFDAIYAEGPDVTVGGAFGPQGEAEVVSGGYRVNGKWAFASGCDNWDYLFANAVVVKDGERLPGPMDDQPLMRSMLVPREQAELLDTWYTLGLRGTGSKHFVLDNVFVPDAYTFQLYESQPCVPGIYRYPVVEFAHHLAGVALGIAQGALADLIASATDHQRVFSRTSVAQTPVVQQTVGRAETSLRAARELTRRQAEKLLSGEAGDDLLELMVWTWANNAWTAQTCIDVVDGCFRANGARGVYDGSPLQRRLRDIYTVAQHATVNEASLTRHGALLFGQEVGAWF